MQFAGGHRLQMPLQTSAFPDKPALLHARTAHLPHQILFRYRVHRQKYPLLIQQCGECIRSGCFSVNDKDFLHLLHVLNPKFQPFLVSMATHTLQLSNLCGNLYRLAEQCYIICTPPAIAVPMCRQPDSRQTKIVFSGFQRLCFK